MPPWELPGAFCTKNETPMQYSVRLVVNTLQEVSKMLRIAAILLAVCPNCISAVASEQSCNTTGILGYPAAPDARCASQSGTLPNSSYAWTHKPSCANSPAGQIA